jgi:flagellar L-ring protein precursor FlgH
MIARTVALMLIGLLGGCSFDPHQIGKEPPLTPVGAGLRPDTLPIRVQPKPQPVYRPGNSLWQDASSDLFKDPRASRVGDIVTVRISIRDRANLENDSSRSRKSNGDLNANFRYSANFNGSAGQASASVNPTIETETTTDSEGEIKRSENINLLVAGVVTDVLPNGNLMISGTQEVRVNFEMRVLQVSGIIRPGDISTENSVSYERMAEARIAYGGRGRITEIQQPGWGQQLIDGFSPY